ncbi:MAG TPA: thioredoxin domain-containing protein [Gelria sp.]|nr:thioredoxin domain-containing protein [Gelria sp.]
MSEHRFTNQLINEKSPYLLQHAHNPVDWYPWSEEAFSVAKKEDKPIFLSIGYSCCHWCHVMERESFEDIEVAQLLNRDFIAIKVDREERPDIDSIYMRACQALTGHGGWPLTIVMTPEQKPFFAATYIPKNSRGQMLGLTELLPRIIELWGNERQLIEDSGDRLSQLLGQTEEDTSQDLAEDIFKTTREHLGRSFDWEWGGFSSAPKFPTPHNIYFLLRYYYFFQDKTALDMAEKTLEAMYRGGIYDHVGGGFARYSTDRFWLVPYFEKMLYDNALLALAYLEAYQLTGKELYARVARDVFTYILRDMTSPEGGFYSAQDADSEGVEGKFYVWSREEIENVVGEEDALYLYQVYDISEKGNFEGKNIPNLIKGLPPQSEWAKLDELRAKLFQEREKRVHPHRDDKILSGWNGMMIAALAYGSRVLHEPQYLLAASRTADFILEKLRQSDGRLLARYRDGEAIYKAYALDYAAMIWGLLELYEAGFDGKYLNSALELNKDLLRYFWDEGAGGLFLYGSDAEQLLTRPKETYDGALPADNSLATLNFLRLGRLTGDYLLEEKADQTFRAFAAKINRHPTAYTFFLTAVLFYKQPGREIVIVGKKEEKDVEAIMAAINDRFLPDTLLVFKDPREEILDEVVPFIKDMTMVGNKATAYICENFSCQQPITDIETLKDIIRK